MVLMQYVEYKASHFLDKSVEAMTGFISCLPGAFSMVWFEAIKGKPINKLFQSLWSADRITPTDLNMYLAEDRIMCFYIILKGYWLSYVPNSISLTDPPDNFIGFLK